MFSSQANMFHTHTARYKSSYVYSTAFLGISATTTLGLSVIELLCAHTPSPSLWPSANRSGVFLPSKNLWYPALFCRRIWKNRKSDFCQRPWCRKHSKTGYVLCTCVVVCTLTVFFN